MKRFSLIKRPLWLEQLEDRRLLHHGPTGGFGVIGDSLSDEYQHETYSYARNWVELLASESHFDLGRHETSSGNPLQWGEPRREGYEYNWARSGATSETLLMAGQHTGLAKQIEEGQVDHAVLADYLLSNEVRRSWIKAAEVAHRQRIAQHLGQPVGRLV